MNRRRAAGWAGLGAALGMLAGCGNGTTTGYRTISTVAGTGGMLGYSGDGGAATAAKLYQPYAVRLDPTGDLYIGDAADEVVRKVTVGTQTISTVAGMYRGVLAGGYSGNGGAATAAQLNGPTGLALDESGNLYLADEANNVVREVSAASGVVSVFAGNGVGASTGSGSYTGDGGLAAQAGFYHPYRIAFDVSGNLFLCDTQNNVIRKIAASTGIVSTVAGTGKAGYAGDGGLATAAQLNGPRGIALDAAGNVYIADTANNVIREVAASTGTISTIAGTGGVSGFAGDGGAATAARLSGPVDVIIDVQANLLIADASNHVVRRITFASGVIDTIAGTTQGFSGDGSAATAAKLNTPYGLAVDATGNLYIADSGNGVVRKVAFTFVAQ